MHITCIRLAVTFNCLFMRLQVASLNTVAALLWLVYVVTDSEVLNEPAVLQAACTVANGLTLLVFCNLVLHDIKCINIVLTLFSAFSSIFDVSSCIVLN